MQVLRIFGTSIVALSVAVTAFGECNRGRGRNGPTTTTFAPVPTSAAPNSSWASFNSINSSPNAALLAAQLQLARSQFTLAQQQRILQVMARRQRMLERQLQSLRNGDSTAIPDPIATRNANPTKQRRRQQNAEKVLRLAKRAEAAGQESKAESNYRRVIRIVGKDSGMGRRASDALVALAVHHN